MAPNIRRKYLEEFGRCRSDPAYVKPAVQHKLDGHDGLVVTFSDGTTGGYVVEELLEPRPVREGVKIKKIPESPLSGG